MNRPKRLSPCSFLFICLICFQVRSQTTDFNIERPGISTGLPEPIAVYNDWSAYDELSDNIPLTEALAMKELDNIIRLKKDGVRIDYFVMDAFWFDIDGGYRTWNKKNWPNGPERWLEACKAAGVKPGLWFSTNLIKAGGKPMLNVIPEWQDSVTSDGATLSLFEGGYLNHLMETLQIYADMGFKVFKFDFAYFDAATDTAKKNTLPANIVELNKTAFIQAIKKFRAKNHDILFIGYNGFGGDMDDTVHPFRKTVDPRWLEIFDTLYSGDPRISDVPMMNFWRSEDLYSDHMVRQFAFNGLPLSRIDNCAFMIGKTGTCYKRGLAAWKGELILTLARGGWLNVYHGNLELIDDKDAAWFAKVQKTYMELQQFGQTSLYGAIPGTGMPYGYFSKTAGGSLFTVVNPSQSVQTINLPETKSETGLVLYHDDGFEPVIKDNTMTLGPEQLAVIGFGNYAVGQTQWENDKDIQIPQAIQSLNAEIKITGDHTASVQINPVAGMNVRILFSQCGADGKPFRSWGGAPPDGTKMNEYLTITAKQGDKNLSVRIEYDKMIWCGLSWAAGEINPADFNPNEPVQIFCSSKDGESKYFKINVYAAK
jgi:hypothetical protein